MIPSATTTYAKIGTSAAISSLLFVSGTGGDASSINIQRLKNPPAQHSHPFVSMQSVIASNHVSSPLEFLTRVEKILDPSISELAKMLQVSRQAIYKWKNGDGMSQDSAEKLHQLALAADLFAEAGIQVTPFMLRRTISNSQNFLEIIEQGGSALESAKTLLRIVQFGQQQRAFVDERLANKKNRKTGSIIDEFPLPYEDDSTV